jgi:hypothetical protein
MVLSLSSLSLLRKRPAVWTDQADFASIEGEVCEEGEMLDVIDHRNERIPSTFRLLVCLAGVQST